MRVMKVSNIAEKNYILRVINNFNNVIIKAIFKKKNNKKVKELWKRWVKHRINVTINI